MMTPGPGDRTRRRPALLAASLALAALQAVSVAGQSPVSQASATPDPPIGDIRQLLLDVEANEKRAEAAQRDYIYHVHTEAQDLDSHGGVKKTTVTEAESLTLDGVRVNRVIARDGVPLTADEQRKEDERLDKTVARHKEKREKLQGKGTQTDGEGDAILPASRILELGTFSNPRRERLNGRSTVVLDYAGDPHAKTRNTFEGVVRDLTGAVWIDEADRILVRGEGQFRDDFKIGGGLVANVHKGTHFDFRASRQADGTWLPAAIDGTGSARFLLVEGFNGRVHVVTSDYRRFRAKATILAASHVLGPDDQPIDPTGIDDSASLPTALPPPVTKPPATKPVAPTPPE